MIEHCTDFRRIKKVWPHDIAISPDCYYLLEVEDEDLGAWFFHPFEDDLVVHVNLNEKCRGQKAAASCRNAFKWIFDNTQANTIYAAIPEARRNVCTLACVVGMEFVLFQNGNRCYKIERSIDKRLAV